MMGTLTARIQITDEVGVVLSGLSSIYIWREEKLGDTTDTLTYYASRTAPGNFEYDEVTEMTMTDSRTIKIPRTPFVTFRHRYDEGAELCVARAILALTEAGMNV